MKWNRSTFCWTCLRSSIDPNCNSTGFSSKVEKWTKAQITKIWELPPSYSPYPLSTKLDDFHWFFWFSWEAKGRNSQIRKNLAGSEGGCHTLIQVLAAVCVETMLLSKHLAPGRGSIIQVLWEPGGFRTTKTKGAENSGLKIAAIPA